MPSLLQQREAIAKKVTPYVVKALEEFGNQKWKGGVLGGGKFRIYYQNFIELCPERGMFRWVIHSTKGKALGHNDYEYPCYMVDLLFRDDDTATPDNFGVGGRSNELIGTGEVSESALKQALSEILAKNYPPRGVFSWSFEEKGTKRLK